MMYDLESDSVKNFLEKEEANKVGVQLPAGLRPYSASIEKTISEMGSVPVFFADNCYGSCDLAEDEARNLGCDVLVHYGHSDMGIPTSLPVLYIEARMEADPYESLENALPDLRDSKWGLVTTVQHVHHLQRASNFLKERGVDSSVGEPGQRSRYPGQILGCDWGSALSIKEEVDGFVYIGTGEFHPKGVFLATGKPVVKVNPVSNEFRRMDIETESFLKRRMAMLAKFDEAEGIGILVSIKPGQIRLSLAERLYKEMKDHGYNTHLLIFDEIDFGALLDFQLDAFVNTACPRLALDDANAYDFPVITPFEAGVLLGKYDFEPYHVDSLGITF